MRVSDGPWARTLALAGLAGAVLAVAPVSLERRASPGAGAAAGIAIAALLFSLLAFRVPVVRVPTGRAAALTAKGVYLTARSASEEVVWRWGLLGTLAGAVGPVPALGVSTVGFALAHARWQGARGIAVHLVTGSAFGAVFLATGQLLSAIGAHVAYNLLVAVAVEGEAGMGRISRAPPLGAEVLPAQLEHVSKRFGETRALEDVGIDVRRGEIVALLGPNGAGKTTVVAILLGLRRPDTGRARLFGRDPRRAATRRLVGATPQESGFSPTLTVRETVDFVGAHYPAPVPVGELLSHFALRELARRQTGGLSGGQRRRLGVALAFAGDPEAVFLDEPTAGLDVMSRRAVWEAVAAFAGRGRTVFLTTHNLEEAEALATRVIVLSRGRVVADTTVPELKARAGLKRIRLPEQSLPPLRGLVHSRAEGRGRRVLYVADAGEAVRELVEANASLDDLEIRPVSLEDAFLAVTGGDSP